MNSFDSFLNPERKPNIRFKLSPYPDEFEMRLLSAEEDREILRRMQGDKKLDGADALIAYAAEALVVPDLHNADFQDKLSKKAGRPILSPADALVAMTTSSELSAILGAYTEFSGVDVTFTEGVEEIKN